MSRAPARKRRACGAERHPQPGVAFAYAPSLHFFTNEVLAAPASALPSLPTALVSQVSCANAVPTVPMAKVATTAARKIRIIGLLPLELVPGLDPGIPRRS